MTRKTDSAASLTHLYAPIEEDIAQMLNVFDEALFSHIPFVQKLCEHVREYRGKMLRPALVLLSGKATGTLGQDHPALAAVTEVVHIATLVHDDVLDESDTRRKQPTLNNMSGNEIAVITGDYIISRAFNVCSSLESEYVTRRMSSIATTICEGELMQLANRGNVDLTEPEYYEIIRRKTACLISLCCEFGAQFAGAAAAEVEALRQYGQELGVAFQIIDDILDVTGTESAVGKTLGRDLAMGKLTLPLIHGLIHGKGNTPEMIRECLQSSDSSGNLGKWLDEAGSLEYAYTQASEHVRQAKKHLSSLKASPAKDSLLGIADFVLARHY